MKIMNFEVSMKAGCCCSREQIKTVQRGLCTTRLDRFDDTIQFFSF
jgi:hypothetical protein